ncbi:GYF domain-containing protein [Archangium gephyra]|uniref:GYF domain-containing protein n=1 Tax=Archangium gephyra TaxID=48 RepID=UPI003B7CA700
MQSALREVRPDDLDAIFDGALFGPPELEASSEVSAVGGEAATPVPVGAVDWYVERHAQPAGPFRLERLRELWHQGELTPDTLFWCEAWSSWRALSLVPELVAALTISGLPTVAADASVSAAPARPKEDGSGKKVVSALHSLVEEEEVWLRKMKEEKEQEKEEARSAMLDVPITPVPAPVPVPVIQPVVAPVAPPPPAVPVMMAAPEAPEPAQRGKAMLAGVLIGSAAVGIVAGALLLLSQNRGAPAPVSPRPVASSEAAPRQDAPAVAPSVAPAPVVVAPPAVPAPAAQAPAPAPAAQTPAAAPVAVTPAPVQPAPKAVIPPPQPKPVVAEAAPEVRVPRAVEAVPQRRPQPAPAPAPLPAPAPAPKSPGRAANDPLNFDDALDKKFEAELGLSESAPKFKPEDPRGKRNVYIPPEPGKDLPESLSTSDVVQVVGSHKEAILACIETHSPARTSDSGKDRFVVRWRVLPTGNAVDAVMETEALKGTPFARCIEGQVRSWKFPQHRVQSREPVRFPFTY